MKKKGRVFNLYFNVQNEKATNVNANQISNTNKTISNLKSNTLRTTLNSKPKTKATLRENSFDEHVETNEIYEDNVIEKKSKIKEENEHMNKISILYGEKHIDDSTANVNKNEKQLPRINSHVLLMQKNIQRVEERKQKARQMKESINILKENIQILKEKQINENKQHKVVIRTKEKLLHDSISEYQRLKKIYLKDYDHKDYLNLMKDYKSKMLKLSKLENAASCSFIN